MESPPAISSLIRVTAAPRWASGWLFAWILGALLAWFWPFARPDWSTQPMLATGLGALAEGFAAIEPLLQRVGVPVALVLLLVVLVWPLWVPAGRNTHAARWLLSAVSGMLWTLAQLAQQLSMTPPEFHAPLRCEVVVRVVGLPQPMPAGSRWTGELERILGGDAACSGFLPGTRLRVADYQPNRPVYQGGEVWPLRLRLKPPRGSLNPGGFDYERWLFSQSIVATATVQQVLGAPVESAELSARLLALRAWWRANMLTLADSVGVDARTRGLLLGLSIGDGDYLPQTEWQVLLATGTNHLLAISGLHVGMVAGFFAGVVAFFWRRTPWCARRPTRQVAAWVAVIAAWGYALLAGMSVPTERTALMMTIVLAGVLLGRPWRLLDLWLIAVLGVLLLQPFSPLSAGFWLSFGAVLILISLVPPRLHWRGWGVVVPLQVLLTLLLLPVVWGLFDRVAFASVPANLFAVPLITFVLTPLSLLIMLFSALWPWAASGLLWVMDPLTQLLFTGLSLLMGLTPDSLVAAPSWGALLLLMIGLLWLLAPRGWPARPLGLLLCLPALWPSATALPQGSLSLWVFDVGQGSAALIQTRHHALLVDTGADWRRGSGTANGQNAGDRVLIPALRQLGVHRLDQLLISHDARDHAGGLPAMLAAFPGTPIQAGQPLSVLSAKPCIDGAEWVWDGVRFQTLQAAAVRTANDHSCVLRVVSAHGSVLLTGDIEAGAERDLLARHSLDATVLVVPHHGSKTSSTPEFLAAVSPKIAVASVGAFNPFGHPAPPVRERYAARGVDWYQTDHAGAVHWQDGVIDTARQSAWPFVWRARRVSNGGS